MLSIIIPTLNEAKSLPGTIAHTQACAGRAPTEIVVSDCSSPDGTAEVARSLGIHVVAGARGRADALNRGAAVARGDVFLFLHADTLLPEQFPRLIDKAMGDARVVGGAFDFRFLVPRPCGVWERAGFWFVTFINRFRYRCSRGFFGDQAIFVRRGAFDRLGGFPTCELMEDVRFSRRMSRLGKTAVLHPPVQTSPRRFLARGVYRQFAIDFSLIACEDFGLRPGRLWQTYNRVNAEPLQELQELATTSGPATCIR